MMKSVSSQIVRNANMFATSGTSLGTMCVSRGSSRYQYMNMHSSAFMRSADVTLQAPEKTVSIPYFKAKVESNVMPAMSLATANNKEIVDYKKSLAVSKFRKHETDTGSAAVQIAVMTEDVLNLARHALVHKKDKHTQRGYQILLARRKKMMQYLKRTNLEQFKATVIALGLENEAKNLK
jgi:small subunit ribosomal protein S15